MGSIPTALTKFLRYLAEFPTNQSEAWGDIGATLVSRGRGVRLFEAIERNAEALPQVGPRAIARAHAMGFPVHDADHEVCNGMIREMPNRSRKRPFSWRHENGLLEVALRDGFEVVVRELPRRTP